MTKGEKQKLKGLDTGRKNRWGEKRAKSAQIRVDEEARNALETIPERDRRKIASEAILNAVANYKG